MSKLLIDGNLVFKDPEIVLFDKDGTLIDIHHYWVSMIKIRSSLIVERYFLNNKEQNNIKFSLNDAMGVDLKTGRMKADGPVGIKPRTYIVDVASEVVRSKGVHIHNDEMEALFVDVDQTTSENMLPLLRLLPGTVELLKKLKECGIATAVVSTDITSRARIAMEALELDHFFTEIIGGDSVTKTKPAPDLALKVIDIYGCDANKAIVIGDHPVDIKMGESANAGLNIGVLTGLSEFTSFDGLMCKVVQDLTNINIRC